MNSNLKLILENIREDASYALMLFRENAPKAIAELIRYIKKISFWFLITFLVTIPLLTLGIIFESKTIIAFAGLIRAALTLAFFIIVAPVGMLIEALKDGAPGSINRYLNFVRGLIVSELFLIAVISWLPLKNNPDHVLPLIILCAVASFLGSTFMSRKVSTVIVGCLLILTVISFIFPYSTQYVGGCVSRSDQDQGIPFRVDETMSCQDLKRGKYHFFGDKGNPRYHYFRDGKSGAIELYELRSKNKTRPSSGDTLYTTSAYIVDELTNQVCAREEEASRQAKADADKLKEEMENRRKAEKERKAQNAGNQLIPPPPILPSSPISPPTFSKPEPTVPVTPIPSPAPKMEAPVPSKTEPEPKKAYAYCIKPSSSSGEIGLQVSREIANKIGAKILDASLIDFESAARQAEKIIIVDKVKFENTENSGEFTCSATINFRVMDFKNGNLLHSVSTTQEQKAFDLETARKLALDVAIKSANIRLKKVL